MLESLPLFHRIAGQPVIVLGTGEAAQAKRRLVERAGALVFDAIAPGLAAGARLGFVAHEARAPAEADAAALRAHGLLVNVVDQPDLCDFTVPSLLERPPVLVAVGTSGASAGLAKALRMRLEGLLPPSLGALAQALGATRAALKHRLPDMGDRRRALDAALAPGGPLDPLDAGSAARVDGWVAGTAAGVAAGCVEIRLRSADPDDLTLREARLLAGADTIAHEPAVPEAVLIRGRADAVLLGIAPGGKEPEGAGLTVVIRQV